MVGCAVRTRQCEHRIFHVSLSGYEFTTSAHGGAGVA
jgi:hypothetical protein